jgi:hypothetical protein
MGCDIVEKITKNTHQPLPEGKVGQAEWVVVPYPSKRYNATINSNIHQKPLYLLHQKHIM